MPNEYVTNQTHVRCNMFTYFYNIRIYNEMKARSKEEDGETGIYQFDIA